MNEQPRLNRHHSRKGGSHGGGCTLPQSRVFCSILNVSPSTVSFATGTCWRSPGLTVLDVAWECCRWTVGQRKAVVLPFRRNAFGHSNAVETSAPYGGSLGKPGGAHQSWWPPRWREGERQRHAFLGSWWSSPINGRPWLYFLRQKPSLFFQEGACQIIRALSPFSFLWTNPSGQSNFCSVFQRFPFPGPGRIA